MPDTHKPEHWYAETPILVDTLAASVHTSTLDVCEHLEATVLHEQATEEAAVQRFIDEYIAA